jgi:hypothetical protein
VSHRARLASLLGVTFCVLLCLLLGSAAALSATRDASTATIGNPSIDKIIFGGTPANPGITVTGSDLTYDRHYSSEAPTPNPPYTPGGHPGCPVNFGGVQGHDYGTRLYVVDKSAAPLWAAGRYRPRLGELDCIGLVLKQWTSGAIQFRFGSFFRLRHYHLNPGDFVQIVWNHLTVGVHVKYAPGGVSPGS